MVQSNGLDSQITIHLEGREVVVGAVEDVVVYGEAPGGQQGEEEKQLHCRRLARYYQGLP